MKTNALYPGLPNYTGPTSGLFTLLRHEGPLGEFSTNVMKRIAYIKKEKPMHEQAIHLRHIIYVPKKGMPKILQKAYADKQKADADWQKAYADKQKADGNKWLLAYIHKHVKNCVWNGNTLVFDILLNEPQRKLK